MLQSLLTSRAADLVAARVCTVENVLPCVFGVSIPGLATGIAAAVACEPVRPVPAAIATTAIAIVAIIGVRRVPVIGAVVVKRSMEVHLAEVADAEGPAAERSLELCLRR